MPPRSLKGVKGSKKAYYQGARIKSADSVCHLFTDQLLTNKEQCSNARNHQQLCKISSTKTVLACHSSTDATRSANRDAARRPRTFGCQPFDRRDFTVIQYFILPVRTQTPMPFILRPLLVDATPPSIFPAIRVPGFAMRRITPLIAVSCGKISPIFTFLHLFTLIYTELHLSVIALISGGARPPRAQFSAACGKRRMHRNRSSLSGRVARNCGTRGAFRHTRGGCAPRAGRRRARSDALTFRSAGLWSLSDLEVKICISD